MMDFSVVESAIPAPRGGGRGRNQPGPDILAFLALQPGQALRFQPNGRSPHRQQSMISTRLTGYRRRHKATWKAVTRVVDGYVLAWKLELP